jgi:hypothetical protein
LRQGADVTEWHGLTGGEAEPMMAKGKVLILLALGVALSGCAYMKPTADARAQQRYEEYAPKFTDEEKANMSVDEKLAIYNANIAIKHQLVCRRETLTGSHFKVHRCFTREELDAQQEAAEAFMRQARRGSTM